MKLWKLQLVAPLSLEWSQISWADNFPLAPSLLITPWSSFLTNTHLTMEEFSSFLKFVNALCLLFYLPGLGTMIFPYLTYSRSFSIWNRFVIVVLSLDFGSGLVFISGYRIMSSGDNSWGFKTVTLYFLKNLNRFFQILLFFHKSFSFMHSSSTVLCSILSFSI